MCQAPRRSLWRAACLLRCPLLHATRCPSLAPARLHTQVASAKACASSGDCDYSSSDWVVKQAAIFGADLSTPCSFGVSRGSDRQSRSAALACTCLAELTCSA